MFSKTTAWQRVQERGPRYAVMGGIRPDEAETRYADTGEQAERVRDIMLESRYRNVQVYPPDGSVDLARLGRDRAEAKRVFDEQTAILRAGALRALEDGRAEAEVARTAGVTRKTVRRWAGKDDAGSEAVDD